MKMQVDDRHRLVPQRGTRSLLAFIMAMGCIATPARAEVRLGPGDVIDIAVARYPDLHLHMNVASDGTLDLENAGIVAVAGLTTKDARAVIRRAMAVAAFRRSSSEGRHGIVTVEPDEVAVTVAAYRPIYLVGDVGKPGEVPYRTGLSLRQALAIAGGAGGAKVGLDPRMAVDAGAEEGVAALDYALARVRAWRLSTELGATETLDRSEFKSLGLNETKLTRIIEIETRTLKNWRDESKRGRAVADQDAAELAAAIDTVGRQRDEEGKGNAADAEELRTLIDLKLHGNVTSARVNDARRAVLLASTRNLQTQAELMRLKLEKDNVGERYARREEERRTAALNELATANANLESARVKLAAAREKEQLVGRHPQRNDSIRPTFILYRLDTGGESHMAIDEATPLEPGDVVDVRLLNSEALAVR